MSEISLRYSANTNPRYVTPFKYVFASIIEYSFAYRRYITLDDTSIFNGPVAITKVATGLSELYDLFVDKQTHPTTYGMGLSIDKNEHDIYQYTDTFIHRNGKKLDEKVEKDKTIIPWAYNAIWSKTNYDDKDILLNRLNSLNELDGFSNIKIINDSDLVLLKDEWVNRDLSLSYFNKDNIDFMSKPDNILNKLDIYNVSRPTLILNINKIYFGTPFKIGLNIYENIFGTPDEYRTVNWIIQLFADRHLYQSDINKISSISYEIKNSDLNNILAINIPYKKSEINFNIFGTTDDRYADLNKTVSSGQENKYSELNSIYEFKKDNITSELNKIYSIIPPDKYGYVFKAYLGKNLSKKADYSYYNLLGKPISKTGNAFTILSGISIIDKLSINKFLSGSPISKKGDIFNTNLHGYKFNYILSKMNNILSGTTLDNILFTQDIYGLYRANHEITSIDLDTFAIINTSQFIMIDGMFLTSNNKVSSIMDTDIWSSKNNKILSINTKDIFVNNQEKELFCENKNLFSSKNLKHMYIFNTYAGLDKDNKYLYLQDYNDFLNKNSHDFILDSYGLFLNVDKKDISSIWLSNDIIITHDRKSFEIYKDTIEIIGDGKSFEIQDLSLFVFKDRKSMDFYKETVNAYKQRNSFIISDTVKSLYKDGSSMYLPQLDSITAWKNSHLSFILNNVNVDLNQKDTIIFKSSTELIKSLIQSKIVNNIDDVLKEYLPINLTKPLFDSYNSLIPLSKVKNSIYIDDINNMIYKESQEGFINSDEFTSILPRNIFMPDNTLICDRAEHKVFIDYKNIFIAKSKMKIIIESGLLLRKDTSLSFVFDPEWLKKDAARIWLDSQLNVSKNGKYSFVNDNVHLSIDTKNVYIDNSLFIDKTTKMCYYDYDIWANKYAIGTQLDEQIKFIQNTKRKVVDYSEVIFDKLNDSAIFYESTVMTNKIIYDSVLANQIDQLYKTLKYANIDVDNFDNWVWVYEYPDPLEKSFGIDELLIPEQDTRYENFEDIIFNKETMRPRNPVKMINDTTFIAKYPIKHPISKYNDIAMDYDASAIKNAQYYGIETSIMHEVFLKYYQIWQTKIYEFSTMTINQSVTSMLNYLYSWIMIYFPSEDLEQALRVFKLIRWYGETAIIQNSQYIISYEYDTLESKLNTGVCAIPNNLDPISNPTMYVDSALGVIRNNPNLVGLDKATVTFEIDNKKNSTISFSLSNTVGSVNIYINDVLVDTVSKSGLNYTYQLPYMGETNYVTIEKEASHNLNPYFYIGNIRIPNASFKNLSIEYDATLKAGNKPLNQMAKKMMSVANLYDNPEEMYAIIKEGNIGVTETYKKMEEYWKLHHENKTKGKRLTIKQV